MCLTSLDDDAMYQFGIVNCSTKLLFYLDPRNVYLAPVVYQFQSLGQFTSKSLA